MMNNKLYNLGLYEKAMPNDLTIAEKLAETSAACFDFMEISIDETDEKLARLKWSKAERLEIVKQSYEIGVGIKTMCLSGHRKFPLGSLDATVRKRSLEIMSDAIELASDLGVRIIQLAGYDEYYNPSNEETKTLFRENLRKCVEMAARSSVILAFETMETPFMDTIEKSMEYVSEINSPYLKIYPDLGNLTNAAKLYEHDVIDDIKLGCGNIAAMHLKETVPGVYRDMTFGAGHVDFPAAIKTAWELGVRMFTAEFWYLGSDNWREDLRSAREFIEGKM
ncbi:MAG: L-ribulose-5-phosphate 3-epimerase [Oscillospiraceae bacterium]|nr:L-ribulose-5-phosphate 3-epimerase [Oscillospiraceae bacterium]